MESYNKENIKYPERKNKAVELPTGINLETGGIVHMDLSDIQPFGYLLTLDLYDIEPSLLDDINVCDKYLTELVGLLKMEAQRPPIIMKGDVDLYPIKGTGLSAWIPLIESGIQFHSISAKRFLSIDIYSCKYFDKQIPIEFTWKTYKPNTKLNPDEVEYNWIKRGLKYA